MLWLTHPAAPVAIVPELAERGGAAAVSGSEVSDLQDAITCAMENWTTLGKRAREIAKSDLALNTVIAQWMGLHGSLLEAK